MGVSGKGAARTHAALSHAGVPESGWGRRYGPRHPKVHPECWAKFQFCPSHSGEPADSPHSSACSNHPECWPDVPFELPGLARQSGLAPSVTASSAAPLASAGAPRAGLHGPCGNARRERCVSRPAALPAGVRWFRGNGSCYTFPGVSLEPEPTPLRHASGRTRGKLRGVLTPRPSRPPEVSWTRACTDAQPTRPLTQQLSGLCLCGATVGQAVLPAPGLRVTLRADPSWARRLIHPRRRTFGGPAQAGERRATV